MIEVKPDERWQRDGDNLVIDLPLSFSQAALGLSIAVPTPMETSRSACRRELRGHGAAA